MEHFNVTRHRAEFRKLRAHPIHRVRSHAFLDGVFERLVREKLLRLFFHANVVVVLALVVLARVPILRAERAFPLGQRGEHEEDFERPTT